MTLVGAELFTSLIEVTVSSTVEQVRDLDSSLVPSGLKTGPSVPVTTAFGGGNKCRKTKL